VGLEVGVVIDTEPDAKELELEPEAMNTAPPTPLLMSPARMRTYPPEPEYPLPTETSIWPALPVDEVPEPIATSPLFVTAEPVERATTPDSPATPLLLVLSKIDPLVVEVLEPETT
jgi:hypothetical protein